MSEMRVLAGRDASAHFPALPPLVAQLDANGRCVVASSACRDWFGMEPEALCGQRLDDLQGLAGQGEMHTHLASVLAGRAVSYECSIEAGGNPRAAQISLIPRVEGAAVAGVFVLVSDLSLLKTAEAAAREAVERFDSTFASAASGIGVVDLDGRWLRVNRAMCDIVGYSESEMLAMGFRDITCAEDLAHELENRRRCHTWRG